MSQIIRCRQGMWLFLVELDTGFVREVHYGGERVAVAIYSAVRGVDWSTLPATISEVHSGENWCRWFARVDGAPFAWTTEVVADELGFRMTIDGTAERTFQTCRTGLCVLHPLSVCGLEATVRQVDGSEQKYAFPVLVAPHQPFMEMGGLRYRARSGVEVEFGFEGEVFETEDQRNWSDASFKTYCHRLRDGRAYTIEAGQRVRQEVRVRCTGVPEPVEEPAPAEATLPEWSIWLGTAAPEAIDTLHAVGFRCVATDDVSVLAVLRERGLAVDLRLTIGQMEQATPVPPPASGSVLWLVSDRWNADAESAVQRMKQKWEPLGWEIGYSSSANFAELNRSRPPQGVFHWIGTPASPQVHTFDAWSILQNAESFASIGASISAFAGGARTCLGPLRFESRFSGDDPRRDSTLSAAYLLLSLASIALGGFARVMAGTASQVLREGSEVGRVIRDILRIRPCSVRVTRHGALTQVLFAGEQGSCRYVVNPSPEEQDGLQPFAFRRGDS